VKETEAVSSYRKDWNCEVANNGWNLKANGQRLGNHDNRFNIWHNHQNV